jgi:hypothetical protein
MDFFLFFVRTCCPVFEIILSAFALGALALHRRIQPLMGR